LAGFAAVEVVAFDMDGTLLDSGDFGVLAVSRAFEVLIAGARLPGLRSPPDPAAIRAQIGKPPDQFYREWLPEDLRGRAPELHARAMEFEREFLRTGLGQLFEGAAEVLDTLKARGLKLMLVSNCSRPYMDWVVETFALEEKLDYRDCVGDKSQPGRNKSTLVAQGLERLRVRRGVMVGDRHHDAEAARANGLAFIACTYGYGTAEELAGADAHLHDIRELPALLA
jgi:phosphoglycolate phosphatase